MKEKIKIAIDFDGTCVTHEYPRIGKNIGSSMILHDLVINGHMLILYTMRSGKELQDALNWFIKEDIKLYGVQKDPEQDSWTSSNKCYANLYIDDAALGCPLKYNEILSSRPYADWGKIGKILLQKGLI